MIDTCKLRNFIVEAKKNTYACDSKKEKASRPNSKDYAYKKFNYFYLDSHIADKDFIGEELIWENEKPCWGMNYKGQLLINETPYGFNKFLKNALGKVSEASPFRGPEYFEDGIFTYRCTWEGDPSFFNGFESISHGDTEIYRLYFHGGNLK